MFDWKRLRAYNTLLSKAELWLMQRCWEQWEQGNDVVGRLDDNDAYRMLEGFVAGWKVARSLDATELTELCIERVYEDMSIERQKGENE